MSVDPYVASGGPGVPQSWNRYAYVQNDPVNWIDPTGLFAQCPSGTRTGADAKSCVSIPSPTETLEITNEDVGGRGALQRQKYKDAVANDYFSLNEDCRNVLNHGMPGSEYDTWVQERRLAALGNVGFQIDVLGKAATAHGIEWGILAAMAIVESSGFQDLVEDDGLGRGPFRINMGQGVTLEQANDLAFAANWTAAELAKNSRYLKSRISGVSSELLLWMTISSHNTGARGQIRRYRNGHDPDWYTSPQGNGNFGNRYGRTILDLMSCFGY
jgi:hypothetical protein